MANETALSASLACTINGASVNGSFAANDTNAGGNIFANVQNVGTTTEQIDLGESTFTVAYWYFRNLDPTNYVEIGLNTPLTQKSTKLMPGKFCLFPASTSTMYALANTAAVNLQVVAVGA